jgi:hypothetical protein
MSKQIDYSQPVTGDDRAYAEQFPGLHGQMLAANAEQFPEAVAAAEEEALEDAEMSEPEDTGDNYDDLTVADLVAEIKRRNEEEGTSLATAGKKPDLVLRLREDDVARASG